MILFFIIIAIIIIWTNYRKELKLEYHNIKFNNEIFKYKNYFKFVWKQEKLTLNHSGISLSF